jgi:D-aminopeptidase
VPRVRTATACARNVSGCQPELISEASTQATYDSRSTSLTSVILPSTVDERIEPAYRRSIVVPSDWYALTVRGTPCAEISVAADDASSRTTGALGILAEIVARSTWSAAKSRTRTGATGAAGDPSARQPREYKAAPVAAVMKRNFVRRISWLTLRRAGWLRPRPSARRRTSAHRIGPTMNISFFAAILIAAASPAAHFATQGPYVKAPALGIHIGWLAPGRYDAITDVAGVRVGQVTHIEGNGKLIPGVGPVRTGVTAVIPRTDVWHRKVFAAAWALNGNGEMTGTTWVNEAGWMEVPILLTNSLSVGRVDDGVVSWMIKHNSDIGITDDVPLPVVAECDDEWLNDMQGRHATADDAVTALDSAVGGPVAQGGVGGGTGMISFEFKGGIGTASRVLSAREGGYTVGVLVNSNTARRRELTVDGVPVGANISDLMPKDGSKGNGSIIIVVATDAPLLHDQLLRLAKRAALGLGRTGATARTGSGDLIIAFSTANVVPHYPEARTFSATILDQYHINPVFDATEDATEEAVINALLAGQTMVGRDGDTVYGLPHDRLLQIMHRYGR